MTPGEIYKKLAEHLTRLPMGYPYREDLEDILRDNLSQDEAEGALAIPTDTIPLRAFSIEEILENFDGSIHTLHGILERLSQRGLVFSGKTEDGENGYALHQVGFGFPQTFFWKGEDTPHARRMSALVAKYFNRKVTMATYFIRMTHEDDCAGCGECVDICPVSAVKMEDDIPVVDNDWCIGCGVCSTVCATDAIEMKLRPDRTGQLPAATVSELHNKIMEEKGL